MNSFFLINNNFLATDAFVSNAEGIARELDLSFFKEKNREYFELQFSDKKNDSWFILFVYNEKEFSTSKQSKNIKKEGYGIVASVDFQFEDPSLFDFLKKLFSKYSTLFIYYEEGHATYENPFIYSKTDIEANESLDMLTKPANQ